VSVPLWRSDFAYVPTWQGWLYVAFVIDVFAQLIVAWRTSSSMRTDIVGSAGAGALRPSAPREDGLVCHSDRGARSCSQIESLMVGLQA
jgi:transposase InsO family protein